MGMSLRVSVIIPTYNGDRFIAEAIESVLNQTYSNWELILIDDGSTDTTRSIIQSFCSLKSIRYFFQTNHGVGAARNRGIEQAQGDLIAFLDQDDYFSPEKLAVQVARLAAQPELGMVSSGWQIVNEQGQPVSVVQPWQGLPTLELKEWVRWKPVFLGAMLFRKEWLERSTFNPDWQQTGDVALVLRLALMGCKAAWVKQAIVGYRQHANNVSRHALQQAAELEVVLDQFFAQPDLPDAIRRLEPESRYQSLVWSAWRLYHNSYPTEMAVYLSKSANYWMGARTEMLLDWIDQFKTYATEYGNELDVFSLTQSKEWQSLIQACSPFV
ncbi:MAG: glycosyltransferase [Cyanobacteria bacterium CRU_2_1]|nr:glycosyltransferase [Cyanobacteria bacterium RU_5_0]NJR60934.1 glycosyltransferase [Cyanobacteria bacterium CRU_2_1]